MAPKLTIVKPTSTAERTTKTTLDTVLLTPKEIESWKSPRFQRQKRVNEKVRAVATSIAESGGIIPGIITVGVLGGERYRLDGQHRLEAAIMSGLSEFYADVRFFFADDMADMAAEFWQLNSSLVTMRPDDYLRALEEDSEGLRFIRKHCKFVGYDMVRRGSANAPVVSMSAALRIWRGSQPDTPTGAVGAAAMLGRELSKEDAEQLAIFLNIAFEAWGREQESWRLWGALNMMLCAWLYRRMVLSQYSPTTPRITKEQFRRCLMSLAADGLYVDWLVGRHIGERDRSPAFMRIRRLFGVRLSDELGRKVRMPSPPWFHA